MEKNIEKYEELTRAKNHLQRIRNAVERYSLVKSVLDDEDDSKGINLLERLGKSSKHYVDVVVAHEAACKIICERYEGESLIERLQNTDRNRMIAHNSVISDLIIVNRYLFANKKYKGGEDVPVGGVYSENPLDLEAIAKSGPKYEDRRARSAIGDWAGYLAVGLNMVSQDP